MSNTISYRTAALCASATLLCGVVLGRMACVQDSKQYLPRQIITPSLDMPPQDCYELEVIFGEDGKVKVYENGREVSPKVVPKDNLEKRVDDNNNSIAI